MATPYVKQTWVDADNTKPLSAARMGVIETGVFDAHYRPSVKVHNTASQAIATATVTALLWDTEEYDTGSMHSTASNTSRLIAPVAGKYLAEGRIVFGASATGFRQANIRANGSTFYDTDTDYGPTAGGLCYLKVGVPLLMAASDYVEMLCSQNSGSPLAAGGALDLHWFSLHLLSY